MGTFEAFYASPLQHVWLLLVAPALYLAWRARSGTPGGGVDPGAAPFVARYTLAFAVLTMLDPLCTGPLAAALGSDTASTGFSLFFVLLGDWRVYLLVFALAGSRRSVVASLLATPVVALSAYALAATWGDAPGRFLWAIHELLFVAATVVLRRTLVRRAPPGRRAFLYDALDYVALYYGLWLLADLIILAGADWGFALRVVPNQLYYALWIPFVHWRFFGRRR